LFLNFNLLLIIGDYAYTGRVTSFSFIDY